MRRRVLLGESCRLAILTGRTVEMECFADLLEDVAFGDFACIAFVDGSAQRLQFGIVLPIGQWAQISSV